MKKIVFIVTMLMCSSPMFAAMVDLDGSKTPSLDKAALMEEDGFVVLNVSGKSLKEVLQAIAHKTGMSISVDDSLLDVPVNAEISHEDWPHVLNVLLNDFNKIFLFRDSKITGVKVLAIHSQGEALKDQKETVSINDSSTVKESSAKSSAPKGSQENATGNKQGKQMAEQVYDKKEAIRKRDQDVAKQAKKIAIQRAKNPESPYKLSVVSHYGPMAGQPDTPPPGAENTKFRPPIVPERLPPGKVDLTPPPGARY